MSPNDAKERRTALMILFLCPLSMIMMYLYVTFWDAPGIEAGHPIEYLQVTCLLWAGIMTIVPILRLAKLVSLPLWFISIMYGHIYLFVVSLCLGLYLNISWWGDFTHIVASIVVTSVVFIGLCLMESRSPNHVTLGSNRGLLLMLFLVTMSFGGIWEMMEGLTDAISGSPYMVYGLTDTIADITADLIGAVITIIIAGFVLKKQTAKEIASKVRLGKSSIEN